MKFLAGSACYFKANSSGKKKSRNLAAGKTAETSAVRAVLQAGGENPDFAYCVFGTTPFFWPFFGVTFAVNFLGQNRLKKDTQKSEKKSQKT